MTTTTTTPRRVTDTWQIECELRRLQEAADMIRDDAVGLLLYAGHLAELGDQAAAEAARQDGERRRADLQSCLAELAEVERWLDRAERADATCSGCGELVTGPHWCREQ